MRKYLHFPYHLKCEVNCLTKDEGGRHTPCFGNYRPQFYFRTTDVTGSIELPSGTEMIMPGDNTAITVKLITPIAMDKGLRFAVREGGKTVGSGVVAEILPDIDPAKLEAEAAKSDKADKKADDPKAAKKPEAKKEAKKPEESK